MSSIKCDFCSTIVKSKYNLKSHLSNNKRCLKLRGIQMETKFICHGCKLPFTNNVNLTSHIDICKKCIILKANEESDKKFNELLDEKEKGYVEFEKIIEFLNEKLKYTDKQLESQQQQYLKQLESQQRQHESKLIGIQTNFEKTIRDLQAQNDKLIDSLRQLASQAIDKPSTSTTNNVTNNTIKNHFSEKYFLETISLDDVKRKCQNYLTEEIFLQGQRGIAKLCTDHIIKTKDNKALMICTDASRKKFKYMDEQGNLKEDHEARAFTEKVSKPIKDVSKIVYENILSDVKYEKENVEETDYSRKAVLNDKELSAIDCFVKITCFDHPDHNNDYKNELAILNK